MRVVKLAAGMAVGYVLGSRAGREKYEQIVATARKVSGRSDEVPPTSIAPVTAEPADVDTEPAIAVDTVSGIESSGPVSGLEPTATASGIGAGTAGPAVPREPRRKPRPVPTPPDTATAPSV